jgi:hypothetical protein
MATTTTTATVAGPVYNAGIPVDRVNTTDSTATGKSEKRRSFFGIGRKDKDKDKDKEKDKGPSPLQQEQVSASASASATASLGWDFVSICQGNENEVDPWDGPG